MTPPGARASRPPPSVYGAPTPTPSAGGTPALPGKGWYSRGYLPHVDAPDLVQAITFRLANSLPAEVLKRLRDIPKSERRKRLDAALDGGMGTCLLADPTAAECVEQALLHFDGERYRLLSWVVIPNHVHCLIEALPGWSTHGIVQAWKSFTAKALNGMVGRSGRLWKPEYFDRYIRDDAHLAAVVQYIEQNPLKAGLCRRPQDWPWSSLGARASRPPMDVESVPAPARRAGGTPALPGGNG